MIRQQDLYASTFNATLSYTEKKNNKTYNFGTLQARYEVRQLTDVTNLGSVRRYQIDCTVRVIVPNPNPFKLTNPGVINYYLKYPALLSSGLSLHTGTATGAFSPRLVDYSPRTLNTAISTSTTSGIGTQLSTTTQRTSGSSTSQANTYGGSVTLQASLFDVGISASAEYSATSTAESSLSSLLGRDAGSSTQQDSGSQMSVKDWSSFASLDPTGIDPTWVWGQEYPWNVIQYRAVAFDPAAFAAGQEPTESQQPNATAPAAGQEAPGFPDNTVILPNAVAARMWNVDQPSGNTFVAPPSELSLFGIDFAMKARWHVDLPTDPDSQTLSILHIIDYVSASHGVFPVSNSEVLISQESSRQGSSRPAHTGWSSYAFAAALNSHLTEPLQMQSPQPLDLVLLGLDPVVDGQYGNDAAIGFGNNGPGGATPPVFLYFVPTDPSPTPPLSGNFKAVSPRNNLLVWGSGFDQASPLLTSFAVDNMASVTVQFKITDLTVDYALYLKNWIGAGSGCTLLIQINESTTLYRDVLNPQGQGGDNNVTQIVLRNRDVTSLDYHDYLVLGLNTVVIQVAPIGQPTLVAGNSGPANNAGSSSYVLQAVVLGAR